MSKKQNKMWILLVSIVVCILCTTPVVASDTQENNGKEKIELYYINVKDAKTSLSISGGIASCRAEILSKKSSSLSISLKLQKYTGGTWKTVQTWTKSGSGLSLKLSKTASVPQGYQYRTVATIKCGSENITRYSPVMNY